MEGLEKKLRTQIAYFHAHKYGTLGYLDNDNFNTKHKHKKFKKLIDNAIYANRHTLIVQHHQEKYDSSFPIWVIIEFFTFGMLSTFYSDMKREDQKNISRSLFGRSDAELRSWLLCLTNLRNACAHYSRLYYTIFSARPATINGLDREMNRKLFDYILIAKELCKESDYWRVEFLPFFLSLMDSQKHIQLEHIGFPENWRDYLVDNKDSQSSDCI
jgi:abortive infection bacteriophage resistance protein